MALKTDYQKIGKGVEALFTQKDEQLETPVSPMVSAGYRPHPGLLWADPLGPDPSLGSLRDGLILTSVLSKPSPY